jgi:peptide-methionine (S)-S-oxide reductase
MNSKRKESPPGSVDGTMWKSRIAARVDNQRIIPDRQESISITGTHFVNGSSMIPPFPENLEVAYFGMGCFWGAEREFWITDGVYTTAVGYAGGATVNPTYDDVCSGRTGHTEAVLVAFDPDVVSYQALLKRFWEAHDPTQGMRQGPDSGSQYRSAIYTTTDRQLLEATASRERYASDLSSSGYGDITTEVAPAQEFFYAEEYHQQYLAKNLARAGIDIQVFYFGDTPPPEHPIAAEGYCGMQPTGIVCPIGLGIDLDPSAGGAP